MLVFYFASIFCLSITVLVCTLYFLRMCYVTLTVITLLAFVCFSDRYIYSIRTGNLYLILQQHVGFMSIVSIQKQPQLEAPCRSFKSENIIDLDSYRFHTFFYSDLIWIYISYLFDCLNEMRICSMLLLAFSASSFCVTEKIIRNCSVWPTLFLFHVSTALKGVFIFCHCCSCCCAGWRPIKK